MWQVTVIWGVGMFGYNISDGITKEVKKKKKKKSPNG